MTTTGFSNTAYEGPAPEPVGDGYGALEGQKDTPQVDTVQSATGLRGFAERFGQRFFPLGYWKEFRELGKIHLPAFLTCFFQFFLQTTSVIMCGHMSKEQLDAVAMACTFINVAGISIGLGLSTGCDTYFSQTYGSKYKKRVGLYLQRSLMVMYMFMIPVFCLNINLKPLLLLLGQDPLISDMTARYILIFLPGIFFDYTFLVLARYLQTQNRVNPPLVCAVIGNVFNAVTQYVAIYVLGYQYEASAACQAASLVVMCLCILVYIMASGVYKETWDGWTMEALCDIGGFIKLAVPGLFLVALEGLSFEVSTFIAGSISLLQLGAQGVQYQAAGLVFMVPLGMSIAVNVRVGQHIGAGQIPEMKHTYKVALTMITTVSIVICLVFLTLKEQIVSIFTSDPEVQAAAAELLTVYSVFPIAEGFACTALGVLKGSGRQLIGAIGNIVAYDVIALPLGVSLSLFTWMQISGFWLALLIGVSCESVVFWLIIWRTDWPKQVRDAMARARGHSIAGGNVVNKAPGDHKEPLLPGRLAASGSCQIRSRSTSRVYSNPYETDVDIELERDRARLPPMASVLRRRILTWLILLTCLAGSIVLRCFQDSYLPYEWTHLGNGTADGNFTVGS